MWCRLSLVIGIVGELACSLFDWFKNVEHAPFPLTTKLGAWFATQTQVRAIGGLKESVLLRPLTAALLLLKMHVPEFLGRDGYVPLEGATYEYDGFVIFRSTRLQIRVVIVNTSYLS